MRIYAFKDKETNEIWAIANKMQSETEEVFNTQIKGGKKQTMVTVVYKEGGILNKVIVGDKYIQISGSHALNPRVGAKNWNDCYIVTEDRVLPKNAVEGKESFTLNEGIEGIGLQGRLEELVKNKYINGFPKEVEENIGSEEYRNKLEKEFKTGVLILEQKRPSEINFEDNQQLDTISNDCIKSIRNIEKVIGSKEENLTSKQIEEIMREKQKKVERAKQIAEELESLAEELGKTPQEFFRGK